MKASLKCEYVRGVFDRERWIDFEGVDCPLVVDARLITTFGAGLGYVTVNVVEGEVDGKRKVHFNGGWYFVPERDLIYSE